MHNVTTETINEFVDFLFETLPFATQFTSNKEGFVEIVRKTLLELYREIPEDLLNYLEKNASDRFLDLLYREAGISDYHIQRVPENLKIRLSYLLNILNLNKSTQKVFSMFHEALEEFYPKMNIYLVEVQPKDINAKNIELTYKLDPRYITDPDNILEDISENELSGAFLMRPEQFIDREEKFSNIYQDYKAKQRITNIFPIKTGIVYIQNPTGLGQAHFDDYIPLMQMIGASKQQYNLIPWKTSEESKRKLIPFADYIKLCTYLKYKEFEFKAKELYSTTYRWETRPSETYGNPTKLTEWNNALFQANQNGVHWSTYYSYTKRKLNDFLLNDEDLAEAERLEVVYAGLKRSGRFDSRNKLNEFKTDWNTLRQKERNISLRRVSDIDEFRAELVGTEPVNILEFELLLLKNFTAGVAPAARDAVYSIKKNYITDTENTLSDTGVITLVKRFQIVPEFNDFIQITYGGYDNAETNENQFLIDLFNYYTKLNRSALLKNYYQVKRFKFPELLNVEITNINYTNKSTYDKVYTELTNNSNIVNFEALNSIIKVRYRDIVEEIDDMPNLENIEVADYTMMFLYLWKILQADLPEDKRVTFFWNEFFMRYIMGSTFKDFFYDPIMDLFLEYWFPAETTTQNKDIQTILIKDKMQTIPLDSIHYNSMVKSLWDSQQCKDQTKITIFRLDGTEEVYDETFVNLTKPELKITIV